jgi:hypothetical protein
MKQQNKLWWEILAYLISFAKAKNLSKTSPYLVSIVTTNDSNAPQRFFYDSKFFILELFWFHFQGLQKVGGFTFLKCKCTFITNVVFGRILFKALKSTFKKLMS